MSSDKVISLVERREADQAVDQENIESMLAVLEEMMARVREGEIRGIGVAYVNADKTGSIGGTAFDVEGGIAVSHLCTMTQLLNMRLLQRL